MTLLETLIAMLVLSFGALCLDTRKKLVTRGDDRVELTRAEYEILEHLWRNAGRVQSKKTIADSYQRDPGADPKANSVEGLPFLSRKVRYSLFVG